MSQTQKGIEIDHTACAAAKRIGAPGLFIAWMNWIARLCFDLMAQKRKTTMSMKLTFPEIGDMFVQAWRDGHHHTFFIGALGRQPREVALAIITYVAAALEDHEAAELRAFLEKQCTTERIIDLGRY